MRRKPIASALLTLATDDPVRASARTETRRRRRPSGRGHKHKDAQCYVRELDFMRATATGKGEGRVDGIVVCSEREEAGLAAAPVALRRLSGLVALRRDLAALVAAARWLMPMPTRPRSARLPRLAPGTSNVPPPNPEDRARTTLKRRRRKSPGKRHRGANGPRRPRRDSIPEGSARGNPVGRRCESTMYS